MCIWEECFRQTADDYLPGKTDKGGSKTDL